MPKLGVCVPFRDRDEHLAEFIPHMTNILNKQNIEFRIYVAHQKNESPFNRGKLLNIAFTEALKDECDYFAFHDVDLLPFAEGCDYSFPGKYPLHLSTEIDEYGYGLPYDKNFGGCVLFTKKQFEAINGFSNEYWGWGSEDDDLFLRCLRKNYLSVEKSPYSLGTKNVAILNGKSSYITIPCSDSLKRCERGDYSISFTVKPHCFHDGEPYIFGDENSTYETSPLLTRHGFELLVYCNTQVFNFSIWDEKNEPTEVWAEAAIAKWINITAVFKRETSEVILYVNGTEVNRDTLPASSREYFDTPFIIGKPDVPSWSIIDNSFFRGEISEVCIWDKALTFDEIDYMHFCDEYYTERDGLILHYNFELFHSGLVVDMSGFENHGLMTDVTIEKRDIGELVLSEVPYRRNNRYRSLAHEKQGVVDGVLVQHANSTKNAKRLFEMQKGSDDSVSASGLSTLSYELLGERHISNCAVMYDVSF